MDFFQKRWTFSDNRLYYPLCVSRRIDTWQIVYLSSKDPCPTISIPRATWTAMELARIHCQLQGSSDRASHFLDAETCEFPSLSMLPV